MGVFGFLVFKKAIAKIQLRKDLFQNGEIITAKVLKHVRKASAFKSNKDYVVIVHCIETQQQIELVSYRYSLFQNLPLCKEIAGFEKGSHYFFPQEVGFDVSFLNS